MALCARISAFAALDQIRFLVIDGLLSRGTLSDAAAALVLGLLMSLLHRKGRLIAYGIAGFYALSASANIANIRVNFANLNLHDRRFLGEEDFVKHSLFSPDIMTFFAFFIAVLAGTYVLLRRPRAQSLMRPRMLVLYGMLAAGVMSPLSMSKPFWQQYNLFEENMVALFKGNAKLKRVNPTYVNQEYKRFVRLDLSGEPIGPGLVDIKRKPNILIITIEGLSEQFINGGYMPNLQKLAEENIHFSNFINHQRFTENGLYSIMCGDMPTMYRRVKILSTQKGIPTRTQSAKENSPNKWSVIGRQPPNLPCLPQILVNNGYNTAFFQASSLGFTNKYGFMRNAGMGMLYGDGTLMRAYPLQKEEKKMLRGVFGMPDAIFMPRVAQELVKINAKGQPWFATLMTTSTHYPLYVADEFKGQFGNNINAAFHTADDALGKLLATLEAQGLLANTLLIVTGDESGAIIKNSDIAGMMAGNWGSMTIKTPENIWYQSEDYFTQSDVMTSVLDYIGLGFRSHRGRSLFRKYNEFRPIMFANIRIDRWAAWYAPDKLIACANYFGMCRNMQLEGPLFEANLSEAAFDKEAIDLYIQVARRSDYTNIKPPKSRVVRRVIKRRR